MSDSDRDEKPPEYKVYRSRRSPLGDRLRPSGDLDGLRERLKRHRPERPRRGDEPGERRPITPGRLTKWVAAAAAAWIALSLVVFLVSAQIEQGASEATDRALSSGGSLLTGANILVLGSDQRAGDSIDKTQSGPARADSILVLHAAFGSVRKLSIPRDSFAQIPGHGGQRINAAYAIGGAGLMVRTAEDYLGNGLEINHVLEVDFEDFPELIDALGGVSVNNKTKICSPEFDNFYKGFNLPKGKQKLDGKRALGFARVRKNPCAPAENDLDRAARQQEVLAGIRRRLLAPTTFARLPWVSWQAPKTIKTDMAGPSLFGLFSDLATGNSKDTRVLKPGCLSCGQGGSLLVSEGERRDAVDRLENGG